jgi:hypothetical protein
MTTCDMTYISYFIKIGSGVQAIVDSVLEIWEAVMLVLLMDELYEVGRQDGFM